MQKPAILAENESISMQVRVQPLQTGYHTIPLRLQNETDLTDSTELSIITVIIIPSPCLFSSQPKPLSRTTCFYRSRRAVRSPATTRSSTSAAASRAFHPDGSYF